MASSSSLTNDEVKHRILNVYAKFVSDVEPDRLFDWLVQEHVITIDQKKRMRHENPIASDRCRAILDHLFSVKHPRAFLIVRQALSKDYHYLVEEIDNQEPGPGIRLQPEKQSASHAKIQELENDLMRYRSVYDDLVQRVHQLESELLSGKNKVQQLEKDIAGQKRVREAEQDRRMKKQQRLEIKLPLVYSEMVYNADFKQTSIFATSTMSTMPVVSNSANQEHFKESIGINRYLTASVFRDVLRVHIREYEMRNGNMYPTKKGVCFTKVQWATFMSHLDNIEKSVKLLKAGQSVEYFQHIGGPNYVTISKDFKFIDIRRFFLPLNCKKERPTRCGIALRPREWDVLISKIHELHEKLPELKVAKPCYDSVDHANQMGDVDSRECIPFELINYY